LISYWTNQLQTITARFQPALKKIPYFGLDFQYGSNNFLYHPTAAPASPAPKRNSENFFQQN